jgi:anti-anti-sigma regulatory factor
MATHINQIDDSDARISILNVDGEMFGEDAQLLTKIAKQLNSETGNTITIDLADLSFLDSDAASILISLQKLPGFEIIGMEIFRQNIVDQAEKR